MSIFFCRLAAAAATRRRLPIFIISLILTRARRATSAYCFFFFFRWLMPLFRCRLLLLSPLFRYCVTAAFADTYFRHATPFLYFAF